MNVKLFARYLSVMCYTCAVCNLYSVSGSNSKSPGLHPPQWTSSDVVTPIRLEQGSAHEGQHHFQKRSVTFSEKQDERQNGNSAEYLLEAFGEQFFLNLDHDASFLAPTFNLHVSGNGSTMDNHNLDTSIHCFYAGHVNGHPESGVVVSLCGGMFGLFHTHNGTQFYIEPQQGGVRDGVETDTKPHVIYTSGPPTDPKAHPPAAGCGLTDDEVAQDQTTSSKSGGLMSQVYGMVQSIKNSLKSRETSNSSPSSKAHHRGKRFISYERFLEMMVVADHKMVEHHGSDVSNYVLTLVAVVNRIFRDPSIGNAINVTLVELRVLTNAEVGPEVTSNAPRTLRNFCIWQRDQNQDDDSHPHHYDTAVLITREDICRSGRDCDTLGLAELGTVCDPLRSCSIVEDNGLSAAFTMAHELGHVFNMLHDSNYKCQSMPETGAGKYAVMAPTLNYYTSPWKWSKCSRKQLTEFLDLGYGECLLDKPTETRLLPSSQPGQEYNISKQCELVFGTGSTLCTYMRTCKRLWCTGSSKGVQTGCRTQHMPWADGTPCGNHHWCFLGECRVKSSQVEVIDGEWGKWGEYSECSRTCGGGVKEAMRNCNDPAPENGGKYCIGRRLRFKSCNTQPCPDGAIDFREKQCAEFNGRQYIKGVAPNTRWVPKYAGVQLKDRCKLYCRVSASSAYYELSKKVTDGTRCGPDTDDICVQGQCRQAGCDHMLSSNTKRDVCGVCGGDNSSCHTIRRTYNGVKHGYSRIVTIPAGATKIDIKQFSYNGRADDDNYLALSNDQDQFILNGNFIVSMYSREVHINKTVLDYSGSNSVVETIITDDKLQRAVNVYILSVGELYPPNVTYSFNVPVENRPIYVWDRAGPWSECDSDCDGIKRRSVRCMDAGDRRPVDEMLCNTRPKPDPIKEECNTRCVVRWEAIHQSDCSTPCGFGYKTTTYECRKMSKKRRGMYVRVDDQYCDHVERPPQTVVCQGPCSSYRWEYSGWSQCSSSCNRGSRTRGALCRDGAGYIVDDSYCDSTALHTVEHCNEQACPEWSISDWSACSVTCGDGEEHRLVSCYQEGQQVDPRQCDGLAKPDTVQRCEMSDCPYWATGPWAPCSVTCESGYQRRAVQCRQYDGQPLDDSKCSAGSRPIELQECEEGACPAPTTTPPPTTTPLPTTTTQPTPSSMALPEIQPESQPGSQPGAQPDAQPQALPEAPQPEAQDLVVIHDADIASAPAAKTRTFRSQWRTGAWTPCSKTCGPGTRERYVSCRDDYGNIDKQDCDPDSRPAFMEVCETKSCPHWRTGDWRECPVSCGEGVTTRYVACVYSDLTITSNEECDPDAKPSREHTCSSQPCPSVGNHVGTSYWRTGNWGSCTVTCGVGHRQRRVECFDDHSPFPSCDHNARPPDREPCTLQPCPDWDFGAWGPCTKSCGGGNMSRVVKCRRRDGITLADTNCDMSEKPGMTVACHMEDCPRPPSWRKGSWSPCSLTCGKGTKTRMVTCRYDDGSLATDEECTVRKPPTTRRCKRQACTQWKSGEWEECSATCGRGVQGREVHCVSGNKAVNETLCKDEKPRATKSCSRPACPRYLWKKGKWSQCNSTCGGAVKTREVWCQDNSGERTDANSCEASRNRPSTKRKCNLPPCLPANTRAFWVEGLWGECTRTCGAGEQTREVTCHTLSEHGWRIPAATSACSLTAMPEIIRRCNMGPCFGDVHWKTTPWTPCSRTCGDGEQRRKVQCQARHGKVMPDRFCRHPAIKPQTERLCNQRPCPPTGCRDLQQTESIQDDGDYTMLIQGRMLRIYCHGMSGSNPAEFLTLPASEAENYSEIYAKRLLNPGVCPNNGARDESCECTNYGHRNPGLTSFNKIRINVTSLEVITDDSTFATVHHGHFIPYATAGDCYSSVDCPQGRFHLSLNGTGLVVAPGVDWSTEGHSVSRRISRDAINQRVSGICGGYCGKCFPDRGAGRLLPLTFHS